MNNIDSAMKVIDLAQVDPEAVEQSILAEAVEKVVMETADTYSQQSKSYAQAREAQPWERDGYMNIKMLDLVRSRISRGELPQGLGGRWRLLDVGAGYGRDVVKYSAEPDIDPVALDNSEGFILFLRKLQDEGKIGANAVIMADMRDLSLIHTGSFQCVRNHATLHHLPVVPHGLGADAAVAETRRILMDGGVFYVLVKAGNGIKMIDTCEGLGGRFYQLFTPQLLKSLIERHSFSVIHLEQLEEYRASGSVAWIFALAVAK
jgi:SAM-dependent methyltransferase